MRGRSVTTHDLLKSFELQGATPFRIGVDFTTKATSLGTGLSANVGYSEGQEVKGGANASTSLTARVDKSSQVIKAHKLTEKYVGREDHHRKVAAYQLNAGVGQTLSLGNDKARVGNTQSVLGFQVDLQNTKRDIRTEMHFLSGKQLERSDWESMVDDVAKNFFQDNLQIRQKWYQTFELFNPDDPTHSNNKKFFQSAQFLIDEAKQTSVYHSKNYDAINSLNSVETKLSQYLNTLHGKPSLADDAFEQRFTNVKEMLKNPEIKSLYDQSSDFRRIVADAKKLGTAFISLRSSPTPETEQKINQIVRGEVVVEPEKRTEILKDLRDKVSASIYQRIDHLLLRPLNDEANKEIKTLLVAQNVSKKTQEKVGEILDPMTRAWDLLTNEHNGSRRITNFNANYAAPIHQTNSFPIPFVTARERLTALIRKPVIAAAFSYDNEGRLLSVKEHDVQFTPLQKNESMLAANQQHVSEALKSLPTRHFLPPSAEMPSPLVAPIVKEVTHRGGGELSGLDKGKQLIDSTTEADIIKQKHSARLEAERRGHAASSTRASQATKSNTEHPHHEAESSNASKFETTRKKTSWAPFASTLKQSSSHHKAPDAHDKGSEKGDPSTAKKGFLAGMWSQAVGGQKDSVVKNATGQSNPEPSALVVQNPSLTLQVDHIREINRSIAEQARHNPLEILKGQHSTSDEHIPHIPKGRGR